ncbi:MULTISPECIES: hypothetical protein [Halostella]|uniref:DUF7521 family protein n=1 Tax=Halostella TaxID=1843185 RepID=UPI00108193D3|nr:MULTISPECIES: hypothetical protein [Halostella]
MSVVAAVAQSGSVPDVGDLSLGSAEVIFLAGFASATVGVFVAALAYRGYARHGSHRMLFLSAGILCLTTLPFALSYVVDLLTAATDAQVILSITASNVAGLAAVALSLRGGPG